jgi:hypothetical protein
LLAKRCFKMVTHLNKEDKWILLDCLTKNEEYKACLEELRRMEQPSKDDYVYYHMELCLLRRMMHTRR